MPTIAEAGLPGYEYVAWFGVFAPGTTPAPLVARINDLLRQALDTPATHELLRLQGVTPELLSPEQFRDKVKSEIEHWVAGHRKIRDEGRTLVARVSYP